MIDNDYTHAVDEMRRKFEHDRQMEELELIRADLDRIKRETEESELAETQDREQLHSEFCQMIAESKFGFIERFPIDYPSPLIDKRCHKTSSRMETS